MYCQMQTLDTTQFNNFYKRSSTHAEKRAKDVRKVDNKSFSNQRWAGKR